MQPWFSAANVAEYPEAFRFTYVKTAGETVYFYFFSVLR